MKQLDFLIIGAPKCGTTSFAHYLSQHPDIFMPDVESDFFPLEYDKGPKFYWDTYFKEWKGEKIIGERFTSNLYIPYVPSRVKEFTPKATLFVVVRNPVERAHSEWWMYSAQDFERASFPEAIARNMKRIQEGTFLDERKERASWEKRLSYAVGKVDLSTYVEAGYYAQYIKRYLEFFPKSQVKIVFFDDLKKDAVKVTRDTWKFLGASQHAKVQDVAAQNEALSKQYINLVRVAKRTRLVKILPTSLKRAVKKFLSKAQNRPAMDESTRQLLIRHYRAHNLDLEKLTGRDLSHWNQ